jgi:tRNA pseudouridine38-40 synthase
VTEELILPENSDEKLPVFAGTHRRYFMEMAYNGANYHGWQVQPNGITIQARMNDALSKMLREPIYCIGCGRTDAGVHARQFFLHFDAANPIPADLVFKLNRYLSPDFAIRRIMKMHENAHARFDATQRTYEYHMHFKEDPFLNGLSCFLFPTPDVAKMNQAAQLLLAYKDFKSLHKTGGGSKTTLCNIYGVGFDRNEEKGTLVFTITANRFLRNMVRMTMGALIMIGRGRITIDDFKEVMDSCGEFKYMMPVPACGLYLTSVKYPYL